MIKGNQRTKLNIKCSWRQSLRVVEETFIYQRFKNSDCANEASNSQSPSEVSATNFWMKVLCKSSRPLSSFFEDFLFAFCGSFASGAKRGSIPGNVGRKNGAFSGALGGSLGLFRCYSRL